MTRYGFGVVLAFAALNAMGQEAASDVAASAAPAQAQQLSAEEEDRLAKMPAHPAGTFSRAAQAAEAATPDAATAARATSASTAEIPDGGVTTETNPLKVAYIAKLSAKPAFFRPNPSMPDIVSEDLLRGYAESGKATARNARSFIGYMPKLTVLPCPVGCNGEAYEKAVAAFIDGYEGDEKQLFQHRGELIVQVRWFHARPWYQYAVPYGTDSFGVEFMLEGKVVSIGKQSVVAGQHTKNAAELAHDVGAGIGAELAFTLGLGAKPSYLDAANDVGKGLAGAVGKVSDALGSVFGADGVRSSIQPATDANSNLLPAIDGIKPNEIEPITGMHYIYAHML